MPEKVRRGLGLLAVAGLALCVALPLRFAIEDDLNPPAALMALRDVAGLTFTVCLVGGLALVAWGLLRD